MSIVKLKGKGQMTLPVEIRRELGLERGAVLEAVVEDGKVVLVPQVVMSRKEAFEELDAIAKRARERWEAEGLTDEDIERMIMEEVYAVRYGGEPE